MSRMRTISICFMVPSFDFPDDIIVCDFSCMVSPNESFSHVFFQIFPENVSRLVSDAFVKMKEQHVKSFLYAIQEK